MQSKRLGAQTVKLTDPPRILAGASVVGKKEGEEIAVEVPDGVVTYRILEISKK